MNRQTPFILALLFWLTLLLSGCDLNDLLALRDLGREVAPRTETERIEIDSHTHVENVLVIDSSFPDNIATCRVALLRDNRRTEVLQHVAQVQSVTGRVLAAEIAAPADVAPVIAITLRTQLCLVTRRATAYCAVIGQRAGPPDLPSSLGATWLGALGWLADNRRVDVRESTTAVLGLFSLGPSNRETVALMGRVIDRAEIAHDDDSSLQLRAARLTVLESALDRQLVLQAIASESWSHVFAVARGCNPELRAPIEQRARSISEQLRPELGQIEAHCDGRLEP